MICIKLRLKDIRIGVADGKNAYKRKNSCKRIYRSIDPRITIHNWLRGRDIVEFLGLWEALHNPDFKRIEFDTYKEDAGTNAYVFSIKNWNKELGAIGLITKSGRYGGGIYAHMNIALEFASWITPEQISSTYANEADSFKYGDEEERFEEFRPTPFLFDSVSADAESSFEVFFSLPEDQQKVVEYFASFDEHIKDFRIEKVSHDGETKEDTFKISALHKMIDSDEMAEIPLGLESAGTIKIMHSLYLQPMTHGSYLISCCAVMKSGLWKILMLLNQMFTNNRNNLRVLAYTNNG